MSSALPESSFCFGSPRLVLDPVLEVEVVDGQPLAELGEDGLASLHVRVAQALELGLVVQVACIEPSNCLA